MNTEFKAEFITIRKSIPNSHPIAGVNSSIYTIYVV